MYEEIKNMLVENLHVDPAIVTPEAEFDNDLGINSLEIADLILACEDTYGIEVENEDIQKFITVKDLVDYLEEKTA